MTQPQEPSLAAFPNPLLRYVAATRPAFLSVTFVGCLLGLASAAAAGVRIDPALATLTLFFALVAHAGANVVNDYYDSLSGCDAANTSRVFPFTGGSRFIQNGVLTLAATGRFGRALLLTVIPAGLWLTAASDAGLILIGMLGLAVGWAYSAPPFRLQARGMGEFGITLAWLLVVVGSDFVQRRAFSMEPLAAGLGYALLVASVLYINQFPDIDADAKAGKRTLVVRLGPQAARWGYVVLVLLAYGWVGALAVADVLPTLALLALAPAAANGAAIRCLWPNAERPSELAPAIKLTILATSLHGLTLAALMLIG